MSFLLLNLSLNLPLNLPLKLPLNLLLNLPLNPPFNLLLNLPLSRLPRFRSVLQMPRPRMTRMCHHRMKAAMVPLFPRTFLLPRQRMVAMPVALEEKAMSSMLGFRSPLVKSSCQMTLDDLPWWQSTRTWTD
jgi:hypothetical protein